MTAITIIAAIGMIFCAWVGYLVGRIAGEAYILDKLSHEVHDDYQKDGEEQC